MPRVIAYEDAKANQTTRKKDIRTPFLKASRDNPDLPSALLSQGFPGRVIEPHWHSVDQFQVVTEGRGKLGRHDIAPYCVQFVRAYTPYGPLVSDSKAGLSFLVLRSRFDPPPPGERSGAQYLPESLDRLKRVPDRRPWQIARQIEFPSLTAGAIANEVTLQEVPDIKDEQGLFAYSLTMAPNAQTTTPDPARGDGQYLVIVTGSLWHDNKEHKALTLVFVEPKEGPFQLHAGAEGLEAMILNLPQTKARAATNIAPSATAGYKKWQCQLCAFAYDEAIGLPDDGIPAGTRWKDVPESWTCPDCSSSKSDFQMVEVQ